MGRSRSRTISCSTSAALPGNGKIQTVKSQASETILPIPHALTAILKAYREQWKPNPKGFLFVTRNGRPPSSNKVVEHHLWTDPRRARDSTVRSSCIPPHSHGAAAGLGSNAESRTKTTSPRRRSHYATKFMVMLWATRTVKQLKKWPRFWTLLDAQSSRSQLVESIELAVRCGGFGFDSHRPLQRCDSANFLHLCLRSNSG